MTDVAPTPPRAGTRRALAAAAGALGVLAAVAGSPHAAERATLDARALARAVVREEDHVTALELAQWIRDRRPGLRVIDVRSPAEFDAFHVPTAERIPLDTLVATRFAPDETLVLYSEGGAHAAQAWVLLRALGHERVYFLRGGLYEWLDDVMNPTLAAGASAEARERFARAAELSRYFGGVPRADVPRADVPRADVPRTDVPREAVPMSVVPEDAVTPANGAAGTAPPSVVPTPAPRAGAALLDRTRRRGC